MGHANLRILTTLGLAFIVQIVALPTDSTQSLIVTSTTPSLVKEDGPIEPATAVPKIYQMQIKSSISNRFANTTIASKVKNFETKAQEATFSVVLPETAFISGFVMEVQGKNYTAYVKEKEEAKREYDQAIASGIGAAHVAVSARDSNRFTVSVNVEPESKAAFYLNYEQLLKRQDGRYEQIINIHPGQPVKDLSVEVVIAESRKIVDLKAPPLRSGNEIGNDKDELDPRADLEIVNETSAVVRFSPNLERQKQLAQYLGTKEDEGFSGQFVVQYDVERDPHGGEVLVQDGYFVHFFAPSELPPLPKQVVFVLDTSSSMYDRKIDQLHEAMLKILDELHEQDSFNLVEFNTNVKVWDLYNEEASVWFPTTNDQYTWDNRNNIHIYEFDNFTFPRAYPANADNIKKAKDAVPKLIPVGSTDIHTALRVGLHLVELEKAKSDDGGGNRQPIIVFLTDGDPTVRITSTKTIINMISEFNSGPRRAPIFALSFGDGADKNFLQKLSLRNSGYSKHIYEAADASLQLQDFYKQISSPLLSDVTFKYEPSVTSLTKTTFPVYFSGSEIVVSGWCGVGRTPTPIIDGWGRGGRINLRPASTESYTSMERLWSYLTISQLLEKQEAANTDEDKKEFKRKALDLALKYSFVTPVSSLVVVKPNDTSAVDTETAEGGRRPDFAYNNFRPDIFPISATGAAGFAGVPALPGQSFHISGVQRPAFAQAEALDIMPSSLDYTTPAIIAYTTNIPTITTTLSTTVAELADIHIILPWLNTILNSQGLVEIPDKGNYKLGLNETIADAIECPKTPLNATGHCTLIHECPKVHSLLTDAKVFLDHVCVLKDEFAGICCPN